MTNERAAPFASKPPDEWDSHVEAMRATRMFLLQKMGPTRFVVRGDDSYRKYKVLVGSRARCSCGVHLCLHHLFVMLKVLKVPPTNPLAWQTALVDSEVDYILSCGGNRENLPGEGGSTPAVCREFLRRGSGRGCAGWSTSEVANGRGAHGDQGRATRRLDIVAGEVCPVCREEMEAKEDDTEVSGRVRAGGDLTYCRDGCGNNMHARCMLMYAEHRCSTGERPCCPLCRIDWGAASMRALKEDARHRRSVRPRGRNEEVAGCRQGKSGVASTGDRKLVSVICRNCKVKVHAAFFRCLVCTPSGSWDLCRRCYAAPGVGSGNRNGPCTLVGKHRHLFVQAEASVYPPNWKPANSPEKKRARVGPGGNPPPAAAALLSLQGREIRTTDFELLLTLNASPTPPLHEHLLRALPTIKAEKYGDINRHVDLPPPLPSTTTLSRAHGISENPKNVSHHPLALEPLVHQNCTESLALSMGTGNSDIEIGIEGSENAVGGWSSPLVSTPGVTSSSNDRTDDTTSMAIALLPSTPRAAGTAPVSGSSLLSGTMTCCCCFRGGNGACSTTALSFSTTDRQHPDSPGLRRLPCGHSAHDACLIPILLEGIGGGDPASCSCPIDAFPLFPVLSRHRNRRRRDPIVDGITRDSGEVPSEPQRRGGASASVTPAADQAEAERTTPVSRRARMNVIREALRRRGGMASSSGGGTANNLGLTVIGSGLALVTPPAASGGNTRSYAISEDVKEVRTVSAPEPRSSRHPSEGSWGRVVEKIHGASGHREGCKNSTGKLDQAQAVGGSLILSRWG